MIKTRILILVMGMMCLTPLASAFAQDEAVTKEINDIYAQKEVLFTGETLDIEALVANAQKHNRDDAVFLNRLKNMGNGQLTESTMTKEEMISQMPNAYSLMANSKADIDLKSIKPGQNGNDWAVAYTFNYNTTIQQRDVYGRVMATDMFVASVCVDHWARNAEGVLQTTYAECDVAMSYTQPEVKVQ